MWSYLGILTLANVAMTVALGGLALKHCVRFLRRGELSYGRSFAIVGVLGALGVLLSAMSVMRLPPLWLLFPTLAFFVAPVVMIVLLGSTGWWRAVASIVLTLLVIGATNGIFAAIVISTTFRAFVFSSDSMAPTIRQHDRVLVRIGEEPTRWSVVMYRSPHAPESISCGRVVGLPGDKLEIIGGQLFINGASTPMPKCMNVARTIYEAPRQHAQPARCNGCEGNPIQLGQDEYFILGDNSENSFDSRYWTITVDQTHQPGTLSRSSIIGVAKAVYFPVERSQTLEVYE